MHCSTMSASCKQLMHKKINQSCGHRTAIRCPLPSKLRPVFRTVCTAATELNQFSDSLKESTGSQSLEVGDTVLGRVVHSDIDGAKIELINSPSTSQGYLPTREWPVEVLDFTENRRHRKGRLPLGLVREFKVVDMGEQQLILSAKACDLDVLWARAEQLLDISSNAKENVTVKVTGTNSGGLLANIIGLSLFIPASHMQAEGAKKRQRWQDIAESYMGEILDISILEVDRNKRKIVGSVTKAKEHNSLRKLEVGKLVKGTVRRIEGFGAFVGIKGTKVSGLLHISNISRQHIEHPSAVFSIGEEIYCLVMAMDADFSDISLCTSELELNDGDMINDKQTVWDAAEEQARQFSEHLIHLRQSGFEFDNESE